jgi:hypothetical protein
MANLERWRGDGARPPGDELPLAGVDEALWMSPVEAVLRRVGSDAKAAGAWRGDGRDPGGVAGLDGSGACVRSSGVDLLKRWLKFKKVAMAHSILVGSELPVWLQAQRVLQRQCECDTVEAKRGPCYPLISSIINNAEKTWLLALF